MNRLRRAILRDQRGLTLLELTVVAAILSVLAGLTAAAVTGSTSQSKAVLLGANLAEIQKATDRFNGEHPFSLYPTVNGCLPGEQKNLVTHRCDPDSTAPTFNETNRLSWEAVIWEKAFQGSDGILLVFVDDFISSVPGKGEVHTDGTPWIRTLSDPDGIVTAGLLGPDNHGAQDSPVDGTKFAVYVLDGNGDLHAITPDQGF